MGCVRTWLLVGPTLTLNPCPRSDWGTFNALPGERVSFFCQRQSRHTELAAKEMKQKWGERNDWSITCFVHLIFSKFSARLFIFSFILLWVIFKNTRRYLIFCLSRAFCLKTLNLNAYRLISVIRRCTLISSPHMHDSSQNEAGAPVTPAGCVQAGAHLDKGQGCRYEEAPGLCHLQTLPNLAAPSSTTRPAADDRRGEHMRAPPNRPSRSGDESIPERSGCVTLSGLS